MYVFQADTYCDSCGEAIRRQLKREDRAPSDPSDEWTYDSDDYPKGPGSEEETDYPDHCASDGDCLEPIDLGDYGLAADAPLYGAESRTIGALLSNGLTEEGVSYLRELLDEPQTLTYGSGIGSGAVHVRELTPYQKALHTLWREVFADELNA